MKKTIACNTLVALSTLSLGAFAQNEAGLSSVEQASSGSTNVAAQGFQSAEIAAEPTPDFTRLTLGAGGMLAKGNSQVQSYTALGDFGMRRGNNQLGVVASLNQGSASEPRDANGDLQPMKETVSNYQGRLRYERFFSEVMAGLVQASALNDKFQQLDLRLNLDPGLAIYAINQPTHQWSFDVGYDFQYEAYSDDALGTQTLHSARVATNYLSALNESVTFKTGAEYRLALTPWQQCYWTGAVTTGSEDLPQSVRHDCDSDEGRAGYSEDVARVNWMLTAYARLDAKVSDKFAVQTAFQITHDNSPVLLNYALNDLSSSVSLTYQLF